MSVVGLVGGGDCFGRTVFRVTELAGDPEGFEVGEGSSAGEVTEVLRPVEHLRERGYGFDLHG